MYKNESFFGSARKCLSRISPNSWEHFEKRYCLNNLKGFKSFKIEWGNEQIQWIYSRRIYTKKIKGRSPGAVSSVRLIVGASGHLLVSLSRQPVPSPAARNCTWTDLSWVTRWPFRVDSHTELVNHMIALWETPVREECRPGLTEVGMHMEGADREPVKHPCVTAKFKGSGEPVNYWTVFLDTSNWSLKDGMSTMTSLVAASRSIYPPNLLRRFTIPKSPCSFSLPHPINSVLPLFLDSVYQLTSTRMRNTSHAK